ncbi:MAG: D-glycero-beta-D-manno-heptose-7-phosphate kinase [Bacteroidales bacterium]|nr:D-glycero-beta-D-manno-heptose-7-phosphate kinase [Bacteroidales bacterium]
MKKDNILRFTSNNSYNFLEILKKFSNKKIAVIGDLMLDKYVYGEVERISQEAPIPIIRVTDEKYVPGGAANVAANISTLGGDAFLFGIVGNDYYKDILLDKLYSLEISTDGILTNTKKNTILKTRIIGLEQQLLRMDKENIEYIDDQFVENILTNLKDVDDLSAIIISDYAKGTITENLMHGVKEFSKKNNIILIIDPKPKHKSWYKDASLITPNKAESQQMSGIVIENEDNIKEAGKKLVGDLNSNIIITAGNEGMYVFEKGKEPVHIPTVAKEVYDVTGAGDTVVASIALALSSEAMLSNSAVIANHAAGIKVGKVGTAPVYMEELLQSFEE